MGLFSKPAASALSAWASANPATAAVTGIVATATLAWGLGRTIDKYWETQTSQKLAAIDTKVTTLETQVTATNTAVTAGVTQLTAQASAVQQHAANVHLSAGLMAQVVQSLQPAARDQKAAIEKMAADLAALGLVTTEVQKNTAAGALAVLGLQQAAANPGQLISSYINQAHAHANGQPVGQP